jgi:hypothetical protein
MGDYTPDGSSLVFDVPEYSDVRDGPSMLKAFADSVAPMLDGKAGLDADLSTKTANYVLTADDAGRIVEMNLADANTLTVPPGLPAKTQVLVVQIGAGQTTLVEGDGVTIRKRFGLKIAAQNGAVLLYARTSTDWVAIGATSA